MFNKNSSLNFSNRRGYQKNKTKKTQTNKTKQNQIKTEQTKKQKDLFMVYLPRMFCSEELGGFDNFHSTQGERVNIKQL